MGIPIKKIIHYHDYIKTYSYLEFNLNEVYDFPYVAGEYQSLVPKEAKINSKNSKTYLSSLFNQASLSKIVCDSGQKSICYVQLRPGYWLNKILIEPDEIVIDLYYGGNKSLIYSFYNPTLSNTITLTLSLEEDIQNIYSKITSDPKDPVWRQYFIKLAFNDLKKTPPLKQFQELMTVKQIAEYLQVEEKTINNWTSDGKIPHKKVGRLPRYNKSEIDNWMKVGTKKMKKRKI
jgi:excisionase family DNA binding protein